MDAALKFVTRSTMFRSLVMLFNCTFWIACEQVTCGQVTTTSNVDLALEKLGAHEYDQAIDYFDRAIKIDPSDTTALCWRGAAWFHKKKYDNSIHDLDLAIQLKPKAECAIEYTIRGAAYMKKKDYDRAASDFDEAIRIEPTMTQAHMNRGGVYLVKKEYAKAVSAFDDAMRIDPNMADALNARAWVAATCPDAKFRDGPKALKLARRACEITEWKEPNCLDTLAAAYAENAEFTEAVRSLKKASECPGYATEHKDEDQRKLKLYEQGKPYRDESE